MLVNPYHAIVRIGAGAIADSTLVTMTVMLPIVTLRVLSILVIMVIYMYAMFSNERKFITIIKD